MPAFRTNALGCWARLSSNDGSVPKTHPWLESELWLGRLVVRIKHVAINERPDRQIAGSVDEDMLPQCHCVHDPDGTPTEFGLRLPRFR